MESREDFNTAHIEDVILLKDNYITFPTRYLELYFSDFLEDNNIEYSLVKDQVQLPTCEGFLKTRDNKMTTLNRDDLYLLQISSFHAQHWYNLLPEKSTFPSVLVPLNKEEVNSLIELKKIRDQLVVNKIGKYDSNNEIVKILNNLIDRIIANVTLKGPVFVRLNSLSPKSSHNKVKIQTGWIPKIFDLLIDSLRTYETLSLPMEHSIMIRQWEHIDPAMEFRCFVYRNRLTAISQYHCYNFYKKLQGREEEIRDTIYQFYLKIFEFLPYEDCVMDIIISSEGVKIVEFNSFGIDGMAGSALYNWQRDKAILYATEGKPDIRLVTQNPTRIEN